MTKFAESQIKSTLFAQEITELLKTTFLGFFREDEGSTPVLQPRTQTYIADPLITELEVRRALDGLNPHKGADSP